MESKDVNKVFQSRQPSGMRRWQEFTGKQATLEATGATFAEVEADSALAVAEDV